MADLVTNNSTNNSGISYSTSEMKIGLGNKLLVDAGSVNTVVIGAWNRLMACASTEIQLGSAAEITMTAATSVTWGKSWNYTNEYQTVAADTEKKTAVRQLLLAGGLSSRRKLKRKSEREKANRVLLLTITSFIATLGLSLISIQYPPFEATINEQGELSGFVETNMATQIIVGETFGMLMIFIGQLLIAWSYAKDNNKIRAVSNLSLAANGITSAVYSEPDLQPALTLAKDALTTTYIPALESQAGKRRKGFLKDQTVADLYGENGSATAIFNMIPGFINNEDDYDNMYVDEEGNADAPYYRNWQNPKNGLFPHNHSTNILLQTHSKPNYGVDDCYSSLFIMNNYIALQSIGLDGRENGNQYYSRTNNILVSPQNIWLSNSLDGIGGVIQLYGKNNTKIYRNDGGEIKFSYKNDGQLENIAQPQSSTPPTDTITSEDGDSALEVSANSISISIDNDKNGIFIEDDQIIIKVQNKAQAIFHGNIIHLGQSCKINQDGSTSIDEIHIKARVISEFIIQHPNLPYDEFNLTKSDLYTDTTYFDPPRIHDVAVNFFRLIEEAKQASAGFRGNIDDITKP